MVRAGYATLNEVQLSWSMIDLLEANIVISQVEKAEIAARSKAEKGKVR